MENPLTCPPGTRCHQDPASPAIDCLPHILLQPSIIPSHYQYRPIGQHHTSMVLTSYSTTCKERHREEGSMSTSVTFIHQEIEEGWMRGERKEQLASSMKRNYSLLAIANVRHRIILKRWIPLIHKGDQQHTGAVAASNIFSPKKERRREAASNLGGESSYLSTRHSMSPGSS